VVRPYALVAALAATAVVAGCGGSSSGPSIKVGAARTYELAGFTPFRAAMPGRPTTVAFTIRQPDGSPLTDYRRGSGPHTGVHLIIVRSDLRTIIHRHPPIAADGRIADRIDFPTPGRYRVVVDAYPNTSGSQPNFQLFRTITVSGAYKPQPLEPFRPSETVDGYRFTLRGYQHLRAIQPGFLIVTVTAPDGRPASFTPWYGALAHAIFFHVGSLDYFHTHVCSPGATGCTSTLGATKVTGHSSTPGKLTVGVLVPLPGIWRLFLQSRVDGRVITAPFTLKVR
jgi:hypothetical protein